MLSWDNDLSRHEEKSVVATFTPALNRIQTAPDAVTLLRLLCFCDPESIPISIFTQGCDALYKEDGYRLSKNQAVDKPEHVRGLGRSLKHIYGVPRQKIRHNIFRIQRNDKLESTKELFQSAVRLSKAIQEVQRLSLAAQALEGADRVVRIHDLVHLLLRSKLMTDEERRQWLEVATCVICKAFEEIGDHESPHNWSRCGLFISHIESLGGFAEQYGLEKKELLDASTWAGSYLNACGLFEKAATLNKRILDKKERTFGKRHPDTLTNMNNLAVVLESQGKYEEAERIHRQTLILSKSVLGKEHPDTLNSMNNLAYTLEGQGRAAEAISLMEKCFQLRKQILGPEHPDTEASLEALHTWKSKEHERDSNLSN